MVCKKESVCVCVCVCVCVLIVVHGMLCMFHNTLAHNHKHTQKHPKTQLLDLGTLHTLHLTYHPPPSSPTPPTPWHPEGVVVYTPHNNTTTWFAAKGVEMGGRGKPHTVVLQVGYGNAWCVIESSCIYAYRYRDKE